MAYRLRSGCSTMVVYQWKDKHLIIIQSMRLDVSVGLQYPLKSLKSRHWYQWKNASKSGYTNLQAKLRASRQKQKLPSSVSFYVSCHKKVWLISRVGIPILKDLVKKKCPINVPNSLGFSWLQMWSNWQPRLSITSPPFLNLTLIFPCVMLNFQM